MHAERDHGLAGMVLDSPFSNLRTLIGEIAQSPHLGIKIPSFLVSGACGIIRMMIQSKAGFNIDHISPIDHVSTSFIPAWFIAGSDDDFIPCHHAKELAEKYGGEAEYREVEGDHNARRPLDAMKAAADFFRRAFPVEALYFPPDGSESDLMNVIQQMEIEAAMAERRRRADESQDAQSGLSLIRQTMQHHARLEGCELREAFNCNIGFRLDMATQFSNPPGELSKTLLAGFAFRATIKSSQTPKLKEGSPMTIFAYVDFEADDIPAMLTVLRCDQKYEFCSCLDETIEFPPEIFNVLFNLFFEFVKIRSIPVPPAESQTSPSSNTSNSGEEQVKIMDSLYLLASKPVEEDCACEKQFDFILMP